MTGRRDARWAGRLASYLGARRPRSWWRALAVGFGYLAAWALVAVPYAVHAFYSDSRATVLAGHDVVVSPTSDGWATFDLGAFLPDVRYPTDQRLGVTIDVGATNLNDYNALIDRYAVLASQPAGEVSKVSVIVREMSRDAMLEGALVGLVGPALWMLIGRSRRTELFHRLTSRRAVVGGVLVAMVTGVVVTQQLSDRPASSVAEGSAWQPIGELIPEATVSGEAARLEVRSGLITSGTKTLIASAFDTYDKSVTFYDDLAGRVPEIAAALRRPEDGETVALLVADRHDNVGMDAVSRAIGDAGGASLLLDAGDDTSTGEPWEAFSLDSVSKAFDDYARYGVAGNHDNGSFAVDYLADHGFTMLTGGVVEGPGGIRLLGAPDPRSSGLGSGIRPTNISFDGQAAALADTACAADEAGKRVSTLLVHDRNLGAPALARGCVDLVLSGHLHIQAGPTQVTGDSGRTGTTYTNGTTGGAAYAFALGSKIRRDAQVTLVTYRGDRPVGLQPVNIRTTGDIAVADYVALRSDRVRVTGN